MKAIQPRLELTAGQIVFLDLVRGLAAGLVLLSHVRYLRGLPPRVLGFSPGALGVTLFFLVSGFLIDRSARAHKGAYGIREFLIDRFARIYVCFAPALMFTALIVSSLVKRPDFVGEPHFGVWQFLGNLFMLQGYPAFQLARRAGFDTPWFVHPYALAEPYWTVPIELCLYVVFGIVHFVVIKRRAKLTGPLTLVAAFALLPVLYHAATGWGECLSLVWLLGALGSRLLHQRADSQSQEPNPDSGAHALPRSTGAIILMMGVAAGLLGMRLLSREGDFYDLQNVLFLGALLLGGLLLSERTNWLAAGLIRVPAAFFAKTSYALYLTHNVLLGWAVMRFGKEMPAGQLAALLVFCHVCAWTFWWMFDRHHKRVARWLKESSLARPADTAVAEAEVRREL